MSDPITPEMSISEIVQKYPNTIPVFISHDLHCLGCPSVRFETLREGALAHGMDLDPLLKDLNDTVTGSDGN